MLKYLKRFKALFVLTTPLFFGGCVPLAEFAFHTTTNELVKPAPASATQPEPTISNEAQNHPQPNSGKNARLIEFMAPETAIGLAEATSQTLLKSGQIDFALAITVDLEIETQRMSLDDALDPNADGPRHVLIFEVAMAQATRRVLNLKPVASTVFLGYSGQPYAVAGDDPVARRDFAQGLQPQSNKAQSYIDDSRPLGAPLVFDYSFDKAQIQARRVMTVNAYMVDRQARTYVKSTFDINDQRHFEVAYRISRYDPKRQQLKTGFDSEADVDEFEKDSLSVRLSSLLKDYAAKRDQAQPFTDVGDLRRMLLKERNVRLADVNANTFDARPLNDPRFDSVVAIYTGKGALGSGFYVTPDVVMTNWHVVKEHRFVEMKTYDGRETFGTVLGKDARLDIALIRVENRGRPVAFYTGRNLNLGQDVEAIGHPKRLEFAVTRGIISAVRKRHSINLPRGAGEEVLYIQTDAPINPGNSGGPLFLDNTVVGMNTWGYQPSIADGLNFSIHYSELMNFMNAHLPGYAVPPAGPS